MESVKIKTEYITLQQFLKLVGVLETGGQAKYFLASHSVLVNQEEESRRGRKLYRNDIVLVEGKEFQIQ